MRDHKRLSKFLSLILRHKAVDFALELDAAGYVDLQKIWAVINSEFHGRATQADFDALMAETNRFEINDGKIRALYGHSAVSDVHYPPATPPEYLYHGTVAAALKSIRAQGLSAQARQYVHLSTTRERASEVATRHGTPVLLTIRAMDAHHNGIVFHHPEPQHFLAKSIPPRYIDVSVETD